ncbi:hypothetical protein E3N88_28158 [Mikania micrantha]|uniref:Uncharacterized protein n=1 Tax=Mikania micrantha TaxID=192012 RepID=A0A5N6MZX0_9ASTR|nr:hypothetical protein E3N88_28158 [Mikania micrantha]
MRQRSDEVWPVKRKGGQEKQQSDVLCICLLRNSLGVSGGDWHLNQEMSRLQTGRTRTIDKVPQCATTATSPPFRQLRTTLPFLDSKAPYPFGANVTN